MDADSSAHMRAKDDDDTTDDFDLMQGVITAFTVGSVHRFMCCNVTR